MGIPGSANLLLLGGGAAEAYQIEQSLRFKKASSTQLTRTFGTCTASGGPWTTSMWVKLGFESESDIYALWGADTGTSTSGDNYGTLNSARKWSDYVERNNGSWGMSATVQGVAKDLSAWYHYLLSYNQPNGATLWINGVQQTYTYSNGGSSSGGNFGSEASQWNRNGVTGSIGAAYTTNGYSNFHWSGAIAEVHHLDGTAVSDPYDFGEFDDNGVWRPIEYTGSSYGNEGFYLKFDPSATNGIGHDHSGNGNNWTPSNFTTSGASSDVINDTPTTNHATMLPTWPFGVSQAYARYYANANHRYHSGRNSPALSYPSILLPKSGKYYVEFVITAGGSGGAFYAGNLFVISDPKTGNSYGTSVTSYEGGYGATTYNGSAGSSGASWRSGPHNVAIAIDMDNGDVEYFLNGTSQSSGTLSAANLALDLCITVSGATGSSTTVTYDINFGTRDFVYTPPTGYTGLGTATMPEPDIKNPGEHFKAITYSGNGSSTNAVTGVGFQPDLVWIKNRSAGYNYMIQDSVRGANVALHTNLSNGETTNNGNGHVDSFDSDGFTLGWDGANNGGDTNASGNNYIAWCWKAGTGTSSNTAGSITSTVSANPTAGFSIVTYSGTGSGETVGHGLGVAPAFIITKSRNNSFDWGVLHHKAGTPGYSALLLNTNASLQTNIAYWNNTAPTSTTFSIGSTGATGGASNNYIAYCFAEVEGYSKFGSYTGNGSTSDGIFVYTGFKPAMVITKMSSGADNWNIYDNARNTYNSVSQVLYPDLYYSEDTLTNSLNFYSNGFKLGAYANNSGATYVYMAFAESPFGGETVSPATAR